MQGRYPAVGKEKCSMFFPLWNGCREIKEKTKWQCDWTI